MRYRAFSLLETVIASLTLALALTMMVVLIQQYLRVMRQADGSLQRVAPRQALAELAEESRLALDITDPPLGLQADHLTFQRLRPNSTPVSGPDPWPASRQMTVRYTLEGKELWRSWQWPGQPWQREMVASEVTLFSARRSSVTEMLVKLGDQQEAVRLWHD